MSCTDALKLIALQTPPPVKVGKVFRSKVVFSIDGEEFTKHWTTTGNSQNNWVAFITECQSSPEVEYVVVKHGDNISIDYVGDVVGDVVEYFIGLLM